MRDELDVTKCETLIGSLLRGDGTAWKPFVVLASPAILTYAESGRSLGHRRSDEDAPREILVSVLERLRKDDFRALRTYVEWRRAPENTTRNIADWLRIVTTNRTRDYVTHQMRRSALHTFGVAVETGTAHQWPAMTDIQVVRELREHAECFPADLEQVVRLTCEGKTIEEIAGLAGRTEVEVKKLLRAAVARFRRWVDPDREDPSPPE